jgi:hypothetical protein
MGTDKGKGIEYTQPKLISLKDQDTFASYANNFSSSGCSYGSNYYVITCIWSGSYYGYTCSMGTSVP